MYFPPSPLGKIHIIDNREKWKKKILNTLLLLIILFILFFFLIGRKYGIMREGKTRVSESGEREGRCPGRPWGFAKGAASEHPLLWGRMRHSTARDDDSYLPRAARRDTPHAAVRAGLPPFLSHEGLPVNEELLHFPKSACYRHWTWPQERTFSQNHCLVDLVIEIYGLIKDSGWLSLQRTG